MKQFVAKYNGRKLNVEAISAAKAIFTAARVFKVKPNKVSVLQTAAKKKDGDGK